MTRIGLLFAQEIKHLISQADASAGGGEERQEMVTPGPGLHVRMLLDSDLGDGHAIMRFLFLVNHRETRGKV